MCSSSRPSYPRGFPIRWSTWIRLRFRYPQTLTLVAEELEFEAVANAAQVAVPSASASVVDTTDPRRPVRVAALVFDSDSGQDLVSFATVPGRRYVVYEPVAEAANSVAALFATDLRDSANQVDYLVVAPAQLMAAAQELVDYRSSLGYQARAVALEGVFDEFGYSHRDPMAIREMLWLAHESWRVAPEYLVLVGKGSFDYKDNRGLSGNLLPPRLIPTPSGLFASDATLGDLNGDGRGEVMVGRVPILSNAEMTAYIEKLRDFESGTREGRSNVVLLADDTDNAGSFASSSDSVEPLLPARLDAKKVYVDELGVAQSRSQLLQSLDQGAILLNYFGHGGLDRMAAEGLLTTADVDGLASNGEFPIVSSLTCAVGRFEIPGATSLGEALTIAEDRGAVAVWAPSGLSFNQEAGVLDRGFVGALFDGRNATLGEAIRSARVTYRRESQGEFAFMTEIYNLLGDPALELPRIENEERILFSDGFERGDLSAFLD